MILHSTNYKAPKVSLLEAIANGIAPDGGLYMPDDLPRLPKAFFNNISEMSIHDIAFVVMNMLFGDVLSAAVMKKIVTNALNFDIPLRKLDDNKYVLELFHGPTASFKDVGARFMAHIVAELGQNSEHRDILLATSGDSGGAVANAFANVANTRVCVAYPSGELTQEQVSQFSSLRNVLAIEIDGSFDECQHLVRDALLTGRHGIRLTSGNSINIARELPSLIYFFHAYARISALVGPSEKIVISIPCGNLGSFCAALMAKEMGLPVSRFIAANNANDVFVEYLKTGGFKPQKALITLARAMDVGNPSNIARIIDLYHGEVSRLRESVDGYSYRDIEIAETMKQTYEDYGYIIDPQGATALRAINRHLPPYAIGVSLASAHPGKSHTSVKRVLGPEVNIRGAKPMEKFRSFNHVKIPPTLGALSKVLNRKDCVIR